MKKGLFKTAGNRAKYNFTLTFKNGKCQKYPSGSAVARDLIDVLNQSERFCTKNKNYPVTIKMDKSFTLYIERNTTNKVVSANTTQKQSKNNCCEISPIISSYAPIVDYQSKILVLGSMPGYNSLKTGKYYADKGNIFWNIIRDLFNKGKDFATYEEKIECLKRSHIALWDILSSCERKGSTDKNIKKETYNDIEEFLKTYPNIKKVILNGKRNKKYYDEAYKGNIPCFPALSTSGNNRRYTYEERLKEWQEAFDL